MNFKADDPLAELLSDNSNDDSFFEFNLGKVKKRDSNVNKIPVKFDDLFGIAEELNGSEDLKRKSKPLANSTLQSEADLGFDLKKPKRTSKDNPLDDLFGSLDQKITQEPPKSRGFSANFPISRQSTETTTENSNLMAQRPKTATPGGRRSSDNSSISAAAPPAVILNVPSQSQKGRERIAVTKKLSSTADWLGLDLADSNEVDQFEIHKSADKMEDAKMTKQVETADEIKSTEYQSKETDQPIPENLSTGIPAMKESSNTEFLMNAINIETKNSIATIQQQEMQMSLATQMKNQEKFLIEMQRKQQEMLAKQETQFSALMQKQLQRQSILEQNIRNQQERINEHIQVLFNQSSVTFCEENLSQSELAQKNKLEEIEKLQSEIVTLEQEKLRLEEQISSIQSNFEKEIETMEKFHKKQIQMYEENLSAVESRLRNEIESLQKFYSEKLEFNEKEKLKLKSELETTIRTLREEHEFEIQRLKKSQEDDLESLKDDYRRMLENIRQSKLMEFAAVQDNHSYLEILRQASNNLTNAGDGLNTIRDNLEYKIDSLQMEREKKLEIREKKLDELEKKLQTSKESTEQEKQRLMELVTNLEIQLSTLTKESSENNWLMRQKLASLEGEKMAFEKEKTFIREQFALDEKRIEELKQSQLAEIQKQLLMIQEEKSRFHLERTQFETEKNIYQSNTPEQNRLELEMSMKVAQDAVKSADQERERFFKMQRELEKEKRELHEKENTLQMVKDDLEREKNAVAVSERKVKELLQKVRFAEENYTTKISFVQQKMREISEKEALISKDRLSLSHERVLLQKMKSKLNLTKCSLCRISENYPNAMDHPGNSAIESYSMAKHNRKNVFDQIMDENISQSLRQMIGTTGGNPLLEQSSLDAVDRDENVESLATDTQKLECELNSLGKDVL